MSNITRDRAGKAASDDKDDLINFDMAPELQSPRRSDLQCGGLSQPGAYVPLLPRSSQRFAVAAGGRRYDHIAHHQVHAFLARKISTTD